MANTFSRTIRYIDDDHRPGAARIAAAILLGVAWVGWGLAAKLPVMALSSRAFLQTGGNMTVVTVPTDGWISDVAFLAGEFVQKGDTLLILDTQQPAIHRAASSEVANKILTQRGIIEAQVRSARQLHEVQDTKVRAQMVRAREALAEAEHAAAIATATANRLGILRDDGLLSESEAADAKQRALAAQARVRGAEAALDEIERTRGENARQSEIRIRGFENELIELEVRLTKEAASLQDVTLEADRAELHAPVDGTVVSASDLAAGTWVQTGSTVCTIAPNADPQVVAWFERLNLPLIHVGQPATVWIDGMGEHGLRQQFDAAIDTIESGSDSNLFRVRLRFSTSPPPGTIPHGAPVLVTIETLSISPLQALFRATGIVSSAARAENVR